MFYLRDFIKKGFLNAVGRLADYQIILNAAGWYDKGVLLEADLAEIQSAIDAQALNAAPTAETPSGNEPSAVESTSGDDSPIEESTSGDDSPVEENPSGDDSPVEENDGSPAEETPV